VDPLDSTSRMLSPLVVGEEHNNTARMVSRCCSATSRCRTSSPFSHGRTVRRDKIAVAAPQIERFLSQPSTSEVFTGSPASSSTSPTPLRASGHLRSKYDHLPEAAFYMVCTIEEAVREGKKLGPKQRKTANGDRE